MWRMFHGLLEDRKDVYEALDNSNITEQLEPIFETVLNDGVAKDLFADGRMESGLRIRFALLQGDG